MKTEEFRVGFVVFVALVILVGGVLLLGSEVLSVRERVSYRAFFGTTGGLKPGAPVYLGGVQVGAVTAIDFTEDLGSSIIAVTLTLPARYQDRVRENSQVRIDTEGLLGDKLVGITLGDPSLPAMPPGSVLRSLPLPDYLTLVAEGERIVGKVSSLLPLAQSLLSKIDEGGGSLGKLLNDPALYDHLDLVLVEAHALVSELRVATERLSESGLTTAESVRAAARQVETSGQTLGELITAVERDYREGSGTVPRLLQDDALYEDLSRALDRVAEAANQLAGVLEPVARGEGSLGGLLVDRTVLTSLEDMLNGVRESGLLRQVIERAEDRGRSARIRAAIAPASSEEQP